MDVDNGKSIPYGCKAFTLSLKCFNTLLYTPFRSIRIPQQFNTHLEPIEWATDRSAALDVKFIPCRVRLCEGAKWKKIDIEKKMHHPLPSQGISWIDKPN